MNYNFSTIRILASVCAMVVLSSAKAAPLDWTGGSGTDLLWSTPGNWAPAGPPGANDDVRFIDLGAVFDASINTTVSANNTIRSLWFGQTNGTHHLLIDAGVTLTVRGTNDNGFGRLGSITNATAPDPNVQSTLYVGTKSEVSSSQVVHAMISGEGGALVLDNPNNEINLREAWGAGGGPHRAILDLSGLGTFSADLSRIRVGDGEAGAIRRVEAQLILARTNRITLTGPSVGENVQLLVGNNDVNNNGNASVSHLVLGQDNRLNVDHVLIGARKQQGNMRFLETLVSPSLIMRGSPGGDSRVTAFRIGDESDQSNSGNPTAGTVNLSSGTVDIRADTIIVGKGQRQTGREALGFLTLGAGTLDVNTLEIAFQTSETANNRVDGTVTFNGTTVVVNDLLRLGRSAGSTAPRNATLNINHGSVTVAGQMTAEGTAILNLTNGTLALPNRSPVIATSLTIDDGLIHNAGAIRVTNSLLIANFGDITGEPVFDMGNSGALWDVQGAANGGLIVSNAFEGSGVYVGDLTLAAGATLSPGGSANVGTLAVQSGFVGGNLTLNGATLRFDLSSSSLGVNDLITVTENLFLNATNDVNLTALEGVFGISDVYTLITALSMIGDETYFRVSGPLAQSRYAFTFNTTTIPNSLLLFVGGSGPASLSWAGNGAGAMWDLKTSANWTGVGGAEQFFSLDSVTFGEAGSADVGLAGTLSPGPVVVANPAKNYVFSGSGGLSGAPLTKEGDGSLTFNNTGDNSFGSVTIHGGTVSFSNTGLNVFTGGLMLNGGNVALAGDSRNSITGPMTIGIGASLNVANAHENTFGTGPIQLDGTLSFNQPADAAIDGAISGAGTLIKDGAGTLTLAGDNNGLTSVIQVNGGTLKAGEANALGSAGVTVADGGAVNLNGRSFGALMVTAIGAGPDGSGAILNTAAPLPNALANVTLEGHTTLGGSGPWSTDPVLNSGRWDIRGGSLNTLGQAITLTKTGLNQVTLAGVSVDPALGDIDVQQGLLAFEGSTTSMGDPLQTLTVRAGATVSFFDTATVWDKQIVLFGDGTTPNLFNWNGPNIVSGPLTLNGPCVIGAAPPDRGGPASLTLSGQVGGGGDLIKVSHDTLVLSGTYVYSGETTVSAGTLALVGEWSIANSPRITVHEGATLDVQMVTLGSFNLLSGQTLAGSGSVSGTLIANPGSIVSPGLSIGVLSVSGDIDLQGTTVIELDAARGTNDVLRSGAFLSLGGTLRLDVVAGSLRPGDSFQLFDSPGIIGSFREIVPATPGSGLTWDTSGLEGAGILRIGGTLQTQPQITSSSRAGESFVLSGSHGSPGGTYRVLCSTNVALPIADWTPVQTNMFDLEGNFSVSLEMESSGSRFYLLQLP